MRQDRQLSAFYFVFFLSSSGIMAFRNVYFQALGFSGAEMGLIGSALLVVGIVAQPLWGVYGDRRGAQNRVVLVALVASGGVALGFSFGSQLGVVPLVGLTALFALFWAPIRPVANSLVLTSGHGYGTVRAFGSIAFGVGTLAYGLVLTRLQPVVLFYVYAAGAVVALYLVRSTARSAEASTVPDEFGARALSLLEDRSFVGLLATAFCLGTALTASNSFFVLYMRSIGGGSTTTGVAFVFKTVAEALAFLVFVRVSTSYRTLLVGGGLAHAVVFAVYVGATTPATVLAVQGLLGVGYAAVMTAAVNLADELAPEALAATAQSVLTAVGFGVGGALGELASGRIFDAFGVTYLFGAYAVVGVVAAIVPLVGINGDRVGGETSTASR